MKYGAFYLHFCGEILVPVKPHQCAYVVLFATFHFHALTQLAER